jgi:transketolase
MSYRAQCAHLGSSLSCIEILDAIFAQCAFDSTLAAQQERHRIVFSKGHAAMGFYAVLEQHGLIESALLDEYLRNGSALWGHVTRAVQVPAIDSSTGSLGHGLSLAAGHALAHRLKGRDDLRVFCILSDGECDEGATWEAALFAGARSLAGLTALVDYNHIQSLAPVAETLDLEPFSDKWRAFKWDVSEINGHDSDELAQALAAPHRGRPRMILSHTVKGKGVRRIENTVASHYKPALASDVEELSCAIA